jgi:hypothetical protein
VAGGPDPVEKHPVLTRTAMQRKHISPDSGSE